MRRRFISWVIVVFWLSSAAYTLAAININTTETWTGEQMHGITPTGSGTAAEPYVYIIPDGMALAASGVIRTADEYVTFDFAPGSDGLDMAAGSYFDLTGSSRLQNAGELRLVLHDNNTTGAGSFKNVDITKDSKDVAITGSGNVTINSVYTHVRDAHAGTVTIDVAGSINIVSIDTQDEAFGGNDAGDVIIRGSDVTIGSIDTRAMRTASSTAFSGSVVLEARDNSGVNALSNTINLSGTVDTNSAAGIDGNVTVSAVVVTLNSDFSAIVDSGTVDIHAGIVQHGMTAGNLFIDDSGGGYNAVHDVPWGTTMSFELAESGDFETVSPALINVVLNQPQGEVVTVAYMTYSGTAVEGLDFIASTGTLVFDPCETTETISIDITDDNKEEDDEIFWVVLDSPVGPNVALGENWFHTYTIIDPRPYVEFDTQVSGGTEEVSPAYVAISLSWPTDKPVTVHYEVTGGTATNGTDYNLPAGTLVFDPWQTSRNIRIPIISDPCQECVETIVLRLANPTNARLGENLQHTYSITEVCFPPFADSNTAALWLFDEKQYPYTTLTDASKYEYDLRLEDAGELIEGKFGHALKMSPGAEYNLYYAGWKGIICANHMRAPAGRPSGLWGPTIAPEKLLDALAGETWTCEFWLKLSSVPTTEAAILHLGHAYNPGLAVNIAPGTVSFTVTNAYGGLEAVCPTNSALLSDGQWHHVAFTACTSPIKHYLDGQLQADSVVSPIAIQPVPDSNIPESLADTTYGIFDDSRDYEKFRHDRFNLSLGEDRPGDMELDGAIDELRISNTVRYSMNFTLPDSFSRSYGSIAVPPSVPAGPPLLFALGSAVEPVHLGSRKHLFIDEILVDTKQNVQLTINPPVNPQAVNRSYSGDYWAVDYNDKVCIVEPDDYASDKGITRLWVSVDGLDFDDPKLGVIEYGGSTANNIILYLSPMWAGVFKDLNPNISPQEQFKLTAWSANRGIYLYSSPDMVHWRRNETIMLPLVSGGGCETFWDDQRGIYVNFLKRDPQFQTAECPDAGGRTAVGFDTQPIGSIWKPWPFTPVNAPYFEGWSIPAVTCEGPVVFGVNKYGQVYRTRAIKYPWAPDVYLAFIWRFGQDQVRRTELAVSRDGTNWITYAYLGMYMPSGGTFNGQTIVETLAEGGLIRRGNEIWQYAQYGTGPHGSGQKFDVRLTQRLDGFTSLDASQQVGTIVTRPLVFAGDRLQLNIAAAGAARVAILNEVGQPIPGFDVNDCDIIQGDSVSKMASWNGNSDVSTLSATVVRLRFEMTNTKLYAFQFNWRGDLNGDGVVGYRDLKALSQAWLWSGTAGDVPEDLDCNGKVNFRDFAFLAFQWLDMCR